MKVFTADLHVHTLLSPCAAVEMTPRHIVLRALAAGIDIIAITDHNAGDNAAAAIEAAIGTGIIILPGMEVETREEAHLLTLFETLTQLAAWEQYVAARRSGRKNDDEKFGAQFVVDAQDNLVEIKSEMLLGAINADAEEVTQAVSAIGGITIASHIDRPSYSILSQLGFIPPDLKLAAVEVSRRTPLADAVRLYGIGDLPVITASDAHTIEDFMAGPRMQFLLESPTLPEIMLALSQKNGRGIVGATQNRTT